jgi:hypothetical protein
MARGGRGISNWRGFEGPSEEGGGKGIYVGLSEGLEKRGEFDLL